MRIRHRQLEPVISTNHIGETDHTWPLIQEDPDHFVATAHEPEKPHGVLNDRDVARVLELVDKGAVRTVVLDLGGVLLQTDVRRMLKELTWAQKGWMTAWAVWNRKRPDTQFMFDHLANLVPDNRFSDELQIYGEGKKLPPIMCLWQAGMVSSVDVLARVTKAIADARAENRMTRLDAEALTVMCKMAFDNDSFVRTRAIVPAGLKLLKELRKREDVTVALLTNFDNVAFNCVRSDFPEVFNLIPKENILVSADANLVKPNPRIFSELRDRIGFDPETALMVDDEPRNVQGARQIYRHALLTGAVHHQE